MYFSYEGMQQATMKDTDKHASIWYVYIAFIVLHKNNCTYNFLLSLFVALSYSRKVIPFMDYSPFLSHQNDSPSKKKDPRLLFVPLLNTQ